MKRAALFVIAAFALAAQPASRANAQDASFGCKVLLCAAATAPGWAGIPYCVPVMQQLFLQLMLRGGWPACPEGQASSVGYEPYQACPSGLTPVDSNPDGAGGYSASTNGSLCADLSKAGQTCLGGDGGCSLNYTAIARTPRSDPYYVDITTANGAQRFYFSMQGN